MVGDKLVKQFPKETFFGLDVSIFELHEFDQYVKYLLDSNRKEVFYGHSLWSAPMIKKYPEIFTYGNKADFLVTDGRPFFLLCKMFGLNVKSDLSIPQMVIRVIKIASERKKKVYLLGATKEINSNAILNLKEQYPGLEDCEGHHGYFKDNDLVEIITEINTFKPEIILIGISSPIKEKLSYLLKNESVSKLIIPCGGMIDVLAGKTKITPPIIKKLGLASFYRLIQEPKRLFSRQMGIYWYWIKVFPVLVLANVFNFKFSLIKNNEKKI